MSDDIRAEFERCFVTAVQTARNQGDLIEIDGVVPTSGKFILDGNGNPVAEIDLLRWCAWFDTAGARCQVALSTLESGIQVSTVFLAMDWSMWPVPGAELLYETMIFGGEFDGFSSRYHTRAEAVVGHRLVVELAQQSADVSGC